MDGLLNGSKRPFSETEIWDIGDVYNGELNGPQLDNYQSWPTATLLVDLGE